MTRRRQCIVGAVYRVVIGDVAQPSRSAPSNRTEPSRPIRLAGAKLVGYPPARRRVVSFQPMVRVLFVCLGNVCRSPMAEAVFMHKVRAAGLDGRIQADSAGTGTWCVGEPPHAGTLAVLAKHNIVSEHRARTIEHSDIDGFDLILTMDEDNYNTVRAFAGGNGDIKRLLDFAPEFGLRDVPDPWYHGNFDLTYALVDRATSAILEHIRTAHAL